MCFFQSFNFQFSISKFDDHFNLKSSISILHFQFSMLDFNRKLTTLIGKSIKESILSHGDLHRCKDGSGQALADPLTKKLRGFGGRWNYNEVIQDYSIILDYYHAISLYRDSMMILW